MDGYSVVARFPVLWGDMDALGHVNNARYFTWFESARIEYLRRLGLETEGVPELGPILAHTSCDFLQAVRWPGEISVGARVTEVGNTSFTMEYLAATDAEPARPVARGKGVIVLINYRTGEKIAVPEAMREKIAELS